jgi:hypothetical protein
MSLQKGPTLMLKETSEGVLIALHVIPNASKSQLIGEHNGALKIKIQAPPVDGKANEAIVAYFAELLNLSKVKIEIVRGDKAKSKSLLVRGLSKSEVEKRLGSLLLK